MRKSEPNDLIAAFGADVYQAWVDWVAIQGALSGQSLTLRRKAASDALLSIAVRWETFLSQWLISAVNRDPQTAMTHLSSSIAGFAVGKLQIPQSHLPSTLLKKKHFTVAEVQNILDPNNRNIVLNERKDIISFSQQWLSPSYATALAKITSQDLQVLKAVRSIRNALSHQSSRSLIDANAVLRDPMLHTRLQLKTQRNLSVAGLRSYLLAATNSQTRLELLHTELMRIATLLMVP